ncbi:hypothetical protein GWI72_10105 [Microvirga tunisiensis]|uniref:Membrane-anchored protein n=1 Tax=Pannonibacter tanglangensis TaxID=2750084 RepID=A0A7X5F371_9HYPH|nr:GDYXXLXY domain-containing protein [Pannonibacter sp. XCT-53]NBN78619.1 hypothetical protein [Pannonibacter sp. XCT-53]
MTDAGHPGAPAPASARATRPSVRSATARGSVRWGLIALVQLCLIALPLLERASVHWTGEEVVLAVRPVDPRDLLRGDYVIINLAIARLPASLPGLDRPIEAGEIVHVELAADAAGVFQPVAVHTRAAEAKGPVIAGKASYDRTPQEDLSVDYGLDAFFVPEGEGRAIETTPPERMQLVIALTAGGRSAPLRLLVDGRPILSDAGF